MLHVCAYVCSDTKILTSFIINLNEQITSGGQILTHK